MTSQEAVALSYLEWVRLLGTGAIRLDEKRIFRWRPDRADPVDVVCNLMLPAPDLGTSATSFVLAVLKPEVLYPERASGLYLGQRLRLEAVRSFHSFSDTALAVHRHDAEAAGLVIDLTPLAEGWAKWVAAVDAAERQTRGETLLTILGVPPSDRFGEASDWLAKREQSIAHDDIAKSRDSMFFGWACVLNAQKMITGVAPSLPANVREEADALRRDFDVDQPFLARAPLLFEFVGNLAGQGERPAYLLAMASLKQHERYVIKREGAALDLISLMDDIQILRSLDKGAESLLVQALGERLPGELIRALKVNAMTTRAGATNKALAMTQEVTPRAPIHVDERTTEPARNPPEPLRPPGALYLPEQPFETEKAGEINPRTVQETKLVTGATAPGVLAGTAVHVPPHAVDEMTRKAERPQMLSDHDQQSWDFGPKPQKQDAMIPPTAERSINSENEKRTKEEQKPAPKNRAAGRKAARPKKNAK